MVNGRIDTIQTIELAEGVEIRLRVAGPAARALAWFIDFWIQFAVLIALLIGHSFLIFVVGPGISQGLLMISGFLVLWFYHVPFEIWGRGASPGKRALGLRVVKKSGAPVGAGQSFLRNLLRFVDSQPTMFGMLMFGGQFESFMVLFLLMQTYLFGLVACTLTPSFQRLGDLAAGTVVVYAHEAVARPAAMPPKLPNARRLAPACLLSREEQSAVVSFSERVEEWSEARSCELADHAQPLTRTRGKEGVARLLGIANWIRTSG